MNSFFSKKNINHYKIKSFGFGNKIPYVLMKNEIFLDCRLELSMFK